VSFLLIMAVAAAAAASAGYLASRKPEDADAPPTGAKGGEEAEAASAEAKKAAFEGFPLALGDVVLSGHEERWLAGALCLREDGRPVAALFIAPEGASQRAVAAFPPPRRDIYWLEPAPLASPDEPPATIEIAGRSLRRQGRLPVAVEPHGLGAPRISETALFATYEGGIRDVAVVIVRPGQVLAWVGVRLDEDEYDRLGGGEVSP
jgi:hypothetical protein